MRGKGRTGSTGGQVLWRVAGAVEIGRGFWVAGVVGRVLRWLGLGEKEGEMSQASEILAAGDQIMTVAQVSVYLRIARSTVYRMLRGGELPAFKVRSDWRFSRRALDRWAEQQSWLKGA